VLRGKILNTQTWHPLPQLVPAGAFLLGGISLSLSLTSSFTFSPSDPRLRWWFSTRRTFNRCCTWKIVRFDRFVFVLMQGYDIRPSEIYCTKNRHFEIETVISLCAKLRGRAEQLTATMWCRVTSDFQCWVKSDFNGWLSDNIKKTKHKAFIKTRNHAN